VWDAVRACLGVDPIDPHAENRGDLGSLDERVAHAALLATANSVVTRPGVAGGWQTPHTTTPWIESQSVRRWVGYEQLAALGVDDDC
jgi:hypothetical protein